MGSVDGTQSMLHLGSVVGSRIGCAEDNGVKTSVCGICGEEFIAGAEITPISWRFKLSRMSRYLLLLVVMYFVLMGCLLILSALTSSDDFLVSGVLLVILVIIGGLALSIPRKSRFGRDGWRFFCPACMKRTSIHLWQRSEPMGPHEVAALKEGKKS